jgi:hypothetical protein
METFLGVLARAKCMGQRQREGEKKKPSKELNREHKLASVVLSFSSEH